MRLGEKQVLDVIKKTDFGVYLCEDGDDTQDVLLPKKQVPEGVRVGDSIEVFLYRDSKDRLIATTTQPKLMKDQVGILHVKEVGQIGAFLDWGLEKDLFLPFKQQTRRVMPGENVLVGIYIDKSDRLCATMNVYKYLQTDSSYKKDDMVEGRVYEISKNFGAFVAVDDKYSALIPAKEFFNDVVIGDIIKARVTEIKPDGKINLSLNQKSYLQINEDAKKVLQVIAEYAGVLPFNDKVSSDIIQREMQMSKNAFKKAVGHLYKEGYIEITDKNIRQIKDGGTQD